MHTYRLNGDYIIELSEREYDYYTKEIRDMDEELTELRQENEALKKDNKELTKEYKKLEAKLISKGHLIKTLEKNNSELIVDYNELKEKFDELSVTLDGPSMFTTHKFILPSWINCALENENKILKEKLERSEILVRSLQQEHDNLLDKYTDLRKKYIDIELVDKIDELGYIKYDTTITLETINANLQKENEELKEKLTELKRMNHDTNNILGKINTTLQKDKEALLKENKKLKEKFADLSSGRDCFRTLYNYYSDLCYKRFEEIDALELENKKLRSKIHNLNIRLDKLNAVEDIITKEGE